MTELQAERMIRLLKIIQEGVVATVGILLYIAIMGTIAMVYVR